MTVAGTAGSGRNVALVKYNNDGNAQWAKSIVAGSGESCFYSVTVDPNSNIYAAGYISGVHAYNFGNNTVVNGTASAVPGGNVILVKYSDAGNAQLARSVISGVSATLFMSMALDSNKNIYATGYIAGNNTCDFGNNVTVAGSAYSYPIPSVNILLVKYNSNGDAQWAKSVTGLSSSSYVSAAIDVNGNIYTVGSILGMEPYDFGSNIVARGGADSDNVILVKYGYPAAVIPAPASVDSSSWVWVVVPAVTIAVIAPIVTYLLHKHGKLCFKTSSIDEERNSLLRANGNIND